MTRSGEKTPSPSASSGAGANRAPKPAGGGRVTTETFGRFIGALARLEGGGSGRRGKGGEGAR